MWRTNRWIDQSADDELLENCVENDVPLTALRSSRAFICPPPGHIPPFSAIQSCHVPDSGHVPEKLNSASTLDVSPTLKSALKLTIAAPEPHALFSRIVFCVGLL